jgi:hypothetical protein
MKTFRHNIARERDRDRRCDVCKRSVVLGSLCTDHGTARGDFGHAKLSGLPILRRPPDARGRSRGEWRSIIPLVRAYWKTSPPPPEILARVTALWQRPGNPPPRTMKRTHPKCILFDTLLWFNDPRSRKRPHDPPRGWLRDRYAPQVILASLVAALVFIEERPRSFPGESEACSLGYVFASHWKRPKYPAGHPVPLRATTRRLLAKRIREALGIYLLTTARAVVQQRAVEEAAKLTKPCRLEPPPPSVYSPAPRPNRVDILKARFGITVRTS